MKRIWFSLDTPQKGEVADEILRPEDRRRVVTEIQGLYGKHAKLHDMIPSVLEGYIRPPQTPDECVFAKTTECISADLKKRITPCQYGGDPDCTQRGCMASVGLDALGRFKLGGVVPLKTIFNASLRIGDGVLSGSNRDAVEGPSGCRRRHDVDVVHRSGLGVDPRHLAGEP